MKFKGNICGLVCLACTILLAGSAAAQGGELVRAEWGVPGNRVDVTARVRTFVHDGILQFEVTRFNLGIDPAPHQNKDLIIKVRRWNGEVQEYKYPERSVASLELGPAPRMEHRDHEREERREESFEHREHGLRIVRASFGANGQFVDVTDILRSHIDHGHLFLHVDRYNLGVDPVPGVHKWLKVVYLWDGDERKVVIDEKTDLQLP